MTEFCSGQIVENIAHPYRLGVIRQNSSTKHYFVEEFGVRTTTWTDLSQWRLCRIAGPNEVIVPVQKVFEEPKVVNTLISVTYRDEDAVTYVNRGQTKYEEWPWVSVSDGSTWDWDDIVDGAVGVEILYSPSKADKKKSTWGKVFDSEGDMWELTAIGYNCADAGLLYDSLDSVDSEFGPLTDAVTSETYQG